MLNIFKFGKTEKSDSDNEESPVVTEIIDRLSTLGSTTVKEIMVPRVDVVSLPLDSTVQEIVDLMKDNGPSRIPVWDKSVDDIVGILYVKDLLPYFFDKSQILIEKLLRTPYFIPESQKILTLMKEIQVNKNHMAVVVDEYGGFSGIVSLEDVLEEIVGEIQDEYDDEEEIIEQLSDSTYLLDARTYLEELNTALQLKLPHEEADTLGGFLYFLFGKIPEQNEVIQYENIEFQIVSIEGNKINKIQLTILPPAESI